MSLLFLQEDAVIFCHVTEQCSFQSGLLLPFQLNLCFIPSRHRPDVCAMTMSNWASHKNVMITPNVTLAFRSKYFTLILFSFHFTAVTVLRIFWGICSVAEREKAQRPDHLLSW